MIFEPKLQLKSGENLILSLLKKPLDFYDTTVTKPQPDKGKISMKIRLVQGKLLQKPDFPQCAGGCLTSFAIL